MRRDPSDLKIHVTGISQYDYKIDVPKFLTTTFLPKAIKSGFDSVNKYYT